MPDTATIEKSVISARIEKPLVEKIDEYARRTRHNRSQIIEVMTDFFFRHKDKFAQEIADSLDRTDHSGE